MGRDPATGVAVFAWPAITDEEATVAITGKSKRFVRGIVMSLHEASPARIVPPCPYFGSCGGCQWQHIEYDAQVRFKHEILRSQLQRFGGIAEPDAVLRPPIASPRDFNYRNTSHFAIEPASRTLGYFKRDSHQAIAVMDCPISNAGINRVMPVVNAMLAGALDAGVIDTGAKGTMQVWKVTIRASEATGQAVVVFHSRAGGYSEPRWDRGLRRGIVVGQDVQEGQPDARQVVILSRREIRRSIAALSRVDSVDDGKESLALLAVEVMDDGTVNRLGETHSSSSAASEAMAETLSGVALGESAAHELRESGPPLGAWLERLGNLTYWVGPGSFFQVNTGAAELLLAEVGEHIPPKLDILVDAYAGVGTFALAFAGRAKRVIGFEIEGNAVHSARWTAHGNNIGNADFRQGKAEALMRTLSANETPDLVILDPPRAGCHPNLLAELIKRRIPRLIYVSCDPSTLARDIKALAGAYSLTSARMVDMFPQTYHLETVAVLDVQV